MTTLRELSQKTQTGGGSFFDFSRMLHQDDTPLVKVVPIARGHGGKTALMRTVPCALGEQLPSGLYIGAKDPLAMNQAIREHQQDVFNLQHEGYMQTMNSRTVTFPLKGFGESHLDLELRDIVGQILTHTTHDSPEAQLERYREYILQAAQADVLWVMQSPPHIESKANLARFRSDLLLTQAYLEEALAKRRSAQQCTIAFIVAKIDTLFPTPQAAVAQLSRERLLAMIEPLASVARASSNVATSAIFPVSAFGFGNAVLKPQPPKEARRSENAETRVAPTSEEGEAEWILKSADHVFEPFNLIPLLAYTVKEALGNYRPAPFSRRQKRQQQILQQLTSDFHKLKPWYVPVKGA